MYDGNCRFQCHLRKIPAILVLGVTSQVVFDKNLWREVAQSVKTILLSVDVSEGFVNQIQARTGKRTVSAALSDLYT